MRWLFCGLVTLLVLSSPADVRASSSDQSSCNRPSPDTLVVSGEIGASLAECVDRLFSDAITQLVLDSRGGSAAFALDIAEKLEGRRLTMIVRGECNSSCANYFLPLASTLVVEPGAVILIHGGVDPALVAQAESRNGSTDVEALRKTAERQADFVSRNDVPPGWLLYRDAGSTAVEGLDGAWGDFNAATKAWLVEERMARSCLRNTIVEYRVDDRGRWLSEARMRALRRQGVARSNTVECN